MIEAKCECGQLTFESTKEPVLELCCHCLDCQEATGQDNATIAFFPLDACEVRGEFADKHYVAESGNATCRQFCTNCQTVLFDRSEGFPNLLGVIVDHLQAPFQSNPSCHVYVKDKNPDVDIPATVKQFEAGIV